MKKTHSCTKSPPPLLSFPHFRIWFFFRIAFQISFKQCAPCSRFIAINLSYSGTLLARHLIFIASWEAADFSMGQHTGNHTKPYRRKLLIFSAEWASVITCLRYIPDDSQCHCLSTSHQRCTKPTVLIWKFYYWMWLCVSDAPACWWLCPKQQR